MREVQIRAWCDFCWADGEQKMEATTSFAIGVVQSTTRGPMPKLMEVCDVHAKPLIELADIVVKLPTFIAEKIPAKPKLAASSASTTLFDPATRAAVSPSAQPTDCPVCNVEFSNRGAVVGHVWHYHATTPRPSAPTACPNCGKRERTPQGMATHRRNEHGYDALEEALQSVPNRGVPQLTA